MEQQYIAKSRLFRESYLPGGIIRLRNNAYGMVMGTKNNSQGLQNIEPSQLLDVIQKFVDGWSNLTGGAVDEALNYALNTKSLLIQCPSELYISPYPLLLQCTSCKVLDFYSRRASDEKQINDLKRRITRAGGKPRIKCKRPSCGGHMLQLPYLSVHRCGSVSPINMPYQTMRIPYVTFEDRGGSFFGSSFGNFETGERVATALSMNCPACSQRYPEFAELSQRGTPITGGESFFPHAVQYISLNQTDGILVTDICSHFSGGPPFAGIALDFAEGIVAGLLGIIPPDRLKKQLAKLLQDGGCDKNATEKINKTLSEKRAAYDAYAGKSDDPFMQQILASVLREIADLEGQLAEALGLFKEVRNHIADTHVIESLANERRTQESVFFRGAFKEFTIKDRLQDEPDSEVRESMTQQWDNLKTSYGVDDIVHISNLNVVLATLGYTREKRQPLADNDNVAPVVLKPFEETVDQSLLGKSIVYAMSAETEGLHIRLDPRKILKWCQVQFNWDVPSPDLFLNRTAAHAHLLKTCPALTLAPAEVKRETKFLALKDSAPFHLLHTISHCLLSVAKRHTGYDNKSLTEYLLPMDLSFLIYVTSVQNYTAGGLLTLFKHYLIPWFDDASNFAFQCVFDPVCSDQGGSCSGCVQTVLGCETFNRGLSRAYLFGGEVVEEDKTLIVPKGFWHG
jgi:hypothetical protein